MKIKLSELRQMVKAVIKEETATSNTYKYPTPINKKFLGASGKPFNATGVNWNGEYKVTQEYFAPNGVVFIKTVEGIDITFLCKDKQFYINKTIVSNLEYTKELQSRFCANINKIHPAGGGTPTGAGASTGTGLGVSADKVRPLIQEVRFYDNEKEKSTSGDLVLNITQTFVDKDKTKVILKTNKGDYAFFPNDKFIKQVGGLVGNTTAFGQMLKTPMYNKAYIDKIRAVYCTRNSSGDWVINIGTYSQTDQKEPMNVAESQLRKIVKSIIKEEQDCGCSK